MEEKTSKTSAGALWIRKSKKGNNFLSGSLTSPDGNTVKIVVFKNSYKEEGSSQPDYRIYLDEAPPVGKTDQKEELKKPKATKAQAENEDEIPF